MRRCEDAARYVHLLPNYGQNYAEHDKGHRQRSPPTELCRIRVNHINTLVHVPDWMSDEEATLIVTRDSHVRLDALGGLIAGESLCYRTRPDRLMAVAVGKLWCGPVILTGTRDARLKLA